MNAATPPILVLDDGELDTYEIVLEIEEAFGIKLTESECERIRTVGQLHRLILQKMRIVASSACLARNQFIRSRDTLRQMFGDSIRVRPSTPLARLFLGKAAQPRWRLLIDKLGLNETQLGRPPSLRKQMAQLTLAAALLNACVGYTYFHTPLMTFCIALLALAMTWFGLILATIPWANRPPVRTVGELSVLASGPRFAEWSSVHWSAPERAVWRRMTGIVGSQMGVRADRLIPHTLFVGEISPFDDLLIAAGAR